MSSYSSSGEESDDSSEQSITRAATALKPNERKNALTAKYNEIKLDLDWVERLDLICDVEFVVPEIDFKADKSADDAGEDDFKRELNFHKQGQSAIMIGIPKLHKLNMKTKRPEDYFAQMAKSDEHMKKVREKLLAQEEIMERREKAKKLREQKKFGKKVQIEALQRQQKEKRETLDAIKKKRKFENKNSDDLFDQKQVKGGGKKPKKPMRYKDKIYGFGGQKKRSKYNTAESSADVSKFKSKQSFGTKKNVKKGRPGKSVRQNKRGRGKK